MSTQYSLVAGIEAYSDPKIPAVNHAAADAREVAAAFNRIGFAATDQELLVNQQATRTSLAYNVELLLNTARDGDTVFIFFSGHGFSAGGEAHLVAHDSRITAGWSRSSSPASISRKRSPLTKWSAT